ncbi:MAG: hypothetical protein V4732_19105, partial [Pseudomonadota bacterium]
ESVGYNAFICRVAALFNKTAKHIPLCSIGRSKPDRLLSRYGPKMKNILTIHIFYFLTLEFMFSSLCYADNQHNNKNKFSDEEPLKIVGCTFPF